MTENATRDVWLGRLKEVISERSERKGSPVTYHISTMGCQMNARDSEKLSGVLCGAGAVEVGGEDADIVLFNTCTVRENANEKLYGHLGQIRRFKDANPDMLIGICGCMMQEEDEVLRIRTKYRFVDLVFGTFNLRRFPELLYSALTEKQRIFDVTDHPEDLPEHMPVRRKIPFKSGVNITYGCNNFCTYCIVPYVRGRERSREPEDILDEIRALAADGVIEVMLLGQNVNSYGRDLSPRVSFPDLLRRAARIKGIERIRFMTPHPKDFSDELLDVMAEEPVICRHIHLPLQSGSTEVLKRMNRRYTKEQYLSLVDRIREKLPDAGLTTDIIVGFPGETEEDFLDTLDVVKRARYQSAFTFIYSRRTGTPAASMPDQVAPEVVSERFDRLLKLVQEYASSAADKDVGKTLPVLVEETDSKAKGFMTGRLGNNLMVHFPGEPSLIGRIVPVRLLESRGFYYIGEQEALRGNASEKE